MLGAVSHHASPEYWEAFNALPPTTQELASKTFLLLKQDPRHPSLHLKQIGRFWSARVGLHHRALGVAVPDGIVWFWIGSHANYDRLLNRR
jgi:hypothetical protein